MDQAFVYIPAAVASHTCTFGSLFNNSSIKAPLLLPSEKTVQVSDTTMLNNEEMLVRKNKDEVQPLYSMATTA